MLSPDGDAELAAAERMVALAGVSARLAAVSVDQLEDAVAEGLDDLLLHVDADRWTLVHPGGRSLGGAITPVVLLGAEEALRPDAGPIVVLREHEVLAAAGVASLVAVSAKTSGRAAAVLVVERDREAAWGALTLGLLRAIGDLLGAALARRTAEEAARRADDRYRRLLETSAEGVCLLDGHGRIRYANRSFAELVGSSPAAVIGAPIVEFLAAPDRTAVAARLLHETLRTELELSGSDGAHRWVSCATSALRDDADDESLALVMMTDISVRRAAETALRTSEARFRALVRSSSDVIVVTDETGAVAYASPAVAEVLGHDPAALVGRSPLDLVHPEDLDRVRSEVAALWAARVGSLVVRGRIARAAGGHVPMEATLTNLIDDRAVAGLMITARDISAQLELQASLAHDATHDPVTGLPNRRAFERRLEQACTEGSGEVAVLFADLDGFKAVNDELGHAVGDDLLRLVGHRLRDAVRDEDVVARHGGDEFAILCPGLARPSAAEEIAERIVAAVSAPMRIGERRVHIGVSIGVALGSSAEPASARDLVTAADAAMYAAKARGAGWAVAPGSAVTGA